MCEKTRVLERISDYAQEGMPLDILVAIYEEETGIKIGHELKLCLLERALLFAYGEEPAPGPRNCPPSGPGYPF